MAIDPRSPQYAGFARLKFRPFQGLRRDLQYRLVWAILFCARLLPVRFSQHLGRWMGRIVFPLVPRDRAICEYQLELIYPEMDARQRGRLARRVFENLGMTLWESLAMSRIRRQADRWLLLENEEVLRAAYAEGRGVILITGHMGNWEMFSAVFDKLRIHAKAVARSIANARLSRLAVRHRESTYLGVLLRGSRDLPRQLLSCLKRGQVLLVAIDHDVDVPSVFVDFFGIPANTPRVAASLALRQGVPVVSGFGRRLPNGVHRFRFCRILPPADAKNDKEGIIAYTQLFSDAMEAHIRECPEQWTWNHRRWKRRPEAEG